MKTVPPVQVMSPPLDYHPIWVTGTDTGVGKTYVAAALSAALAAAYWKPIQSGLDGAHTDSTAIRLLTNNAVDCILPERYRLSEPLSPHLAARLDGLSISLNDIDWPSADSVEADYLIIEGAGGVFVPLNETHLIIDLINRLLAPVIVVCRPGLGTINHTLLTLKALSDRGVPICGFTFSGGENAENERIIHSYSGIPYLGYLPLIKDQGHVNSLQIGKFLNIDVIKQFVQQVAGSGRS